MSIELEKYVLDRLVRAEKSLVTTNVESMELKQKIRELESIQGSLAAQVASLTDDKNHYMIKATSLETTAKIVGPRLDELWKAASQASDTMKAAAARWKDYRSIHDRLKKALDATIYDCTDEIPF